VRPTRLVFAALLVGMLAGFSAPPAASAQPELVVGVYEDPPFAMKDPRGDWRGVAVSLWSEVARREGIRFRFEEGELEPLLEALAAHRIDVVIGPLLITPHRAERFDMTSSFMHVSLAIATPPASWVSTLSGLGDLFNRRLLSTVSVLLGTLIAVAVVVWWLERHRNPAHFGGERMKGVGDAMWWSASTMTTVGYGDRTPITLWGRVVGVVWMFVSVVLVATFTATVSSELTVGQLRSDVRTLRDLSGRRVGVVDGSGADEYLDGLNVAAARYGSVEAGLNDLLQGRLDAFVDEWPVLRWAQNGSFAGRIAVIAQPQTRGYVGFALPLDSPRRRPIDVALLDVLDDPVWQDILNTELGAD
jgi:ABC-type amino acid transport substrate-binding protein